MLIKAAVVAGVYLWLWLRLVYGPFGLVGVIETGALESKSIVPIFFASGSSLVFLDSTDCDLNRALFVGCVQTIDVWGM